MQIKVYTINVKLPRWLGRALVLGVVPATVLGICAVVYATAVTGQPDFVANSPLSASSLNAHLGALQAQIDTANGKLTTVQQTMLAPDANGNVGIGTTSPGAKLDVESVADVLVGKFYQDKNDGGTANVLEIRDDRGYAGADTGNALYVRSWRSGGNDSGNLMSLNVTEGGADIPVLVTTINGNVGIGTASPSGNLTIKADKTGFQELSNQLVIKGRTKDNLNLSLGMMTDISAAMIQSNENGVINHDLLLNPNGGRVGVNTTAAQYTLDVTGTIRGDNVTPSDRALKKNIEPLPADTLSRVCKISGVSFEWDREKLKTNAREVDGFPKTQQIGLIAQDVEKVFPSLIETDSKGVKSIHYMGVTAVLLEAVKSQQQQIEDLKARVRALEEPRAGARAAHSRPVQHPSRRATVGIERLPSQAPGA